MKRILITIIIALAFPLVVAAQNIMEGKVTYASSTKIKFDESRFEQMSEERREQMKKRMKKWGKSKMVLVYNKEESLYRNYKAELDAKTDEEWEQASGKGGRWKMMRPQSKVYQHYESKKVVEQQEMFDKKFLIEDERDKLQWKMTGKQEKILEYPCMQATTTMHDTIAVTAWFCPQLPIPTGPYGIGDLPGMILKLEIVGGQMGELTMTANNIEFTTHDKGAIEEPTKGKEVTREEFHQIVKEKMKEMREMYGGRGGPHGH